MLIEIPIIGMYSKPIVVLHLICIIVVALLKTSGDGEVHCRDWHIRNIAFSEVTDVDDNSTLRLIGVTMSYSLSSRCMNVCLQP